MGFYGMEYKKICFTRCLSAMALSIFMQYLLLTLFLLVVNFHVFHPILWLRETLGLLLSLYTWITVIPLIIVLIAHGFLFAKPLQTARTYYPSRFSWLLGTALRKFGFLITHMLVGFLTAWLYTRHLHDDYRNFTFNCNMDTECVNSRFMFLVIAGLAAGCYHYVKDNLRQDQEVEFSIIQEEKLAQIRSLLYITLRQSLAKSFGPTMIFAFCYWLLGGMLNRYVASFFGVQGIDETLDSFISIATNFRLLFYTWILYSHILSNMHLMQRFFSIFMTEELYFSVEASPIQRELGTEITLVDALAMQQMPIVQKLAALNLYNISRNKMSKQRTEIFMLTLPGGHPYNWNQLSSQCLSIINAFTEELTKSVKNISTMKTEPLFANEKTSASVAAERILLRQFNQTVGIRRMMTEQCVPTATLSPRQVPQPSRGYEQLATQLESMLRTAFRSIPGLFYLFGEQDGAKTAFVLSNSQEIVWLTQGLAGICVASLLEDSYGVVQVTLPQILKSLLNLKMVLNKLNNVNLNGKKWDRNLITLKNAVRRSLYKICTVFGEYLRDIMTDPEDLRCLQHFLTYQET